MATLTETLYTLERVLSQVAPDAADRLQSGLTRAEIDQCVTSFSWQLPQDAYDLYQWHNGLSGKPGKLNLAEKFLRLKGKWHGELSGRENELHLKLDVGQAPPLENRLVIAKFLPLDSNLTFLSEVRLTLSLYGYYISESNEYVLRLTAVKSARCVFLSALKRLSFQHDRNFLMKRQSSTSGDSCIAHRH